MSSLRILLVDDFEVWRQRIRSILESQAEFQVIGEASDGFEAVQKAEALKPDLILLDIGLPHLNGIEAENRLCRLVPSAKVLFLSQNMDPDIVRVALSNGACGYVLKIDAGSELLPAINAIFQGLRFVSSGLQGVRL
jgi:DNA-binding NarL/FixJ family response regulator